MTEYVYLPDYEGEWSTMDRREYETTGGEGEYGRAEAAELVVHLDDYRGHYLQADWLAEVADLIGEAPGDDPITHVDRMAKLDALKQEAKDASERYHKHHDLSSDESCPDDCQCEFIGEVVDDVTGIISEAGYVTEWGDGVSTFRVVEGS